MTGGTAMTGTAAVAGGQAAMALAGTELAVMVQVVTVRAVMDAGAMRLRSAACRPRCGARHL